ncbi:MAG: hypothetical protein WCF15_11320 [Pseudolabrys sp.]
MKYQNCAAVAQAPDEPLELDVGLRLSDANINPSTGLATDYLNRFNEAVMLLDMLATLPGTPRRLSVVGADELSRALSRLAFPDTRARPCRETADSNVRSSLDTLAVTMAVVLEATRAAMTSDLKLETIAALAGNAVGWLKPLIARAGAIINGDEEVTDAPSPQAVVDQLMKR